MTPADLAAFSTKTYTAPGVLGRIVAERTQDYADATFALGTARPRRRRFHAALAKSGLQLIAEVKGASPSQGAIAKLDPAAAALAYVRGGAACLSVLTEPRHFDGSPEALRQVVAALDRSAVPVPVLRKDFVIHPRMLEEAADWGASAALLMVSVLGQDVGEYLHLAHHLGLDALVEVHDEAELGVALAAGAEIIGVNNRDLISLKINLHNSPRMIAHARAAGYEGLLVAESGYATPTDISTIRRSADAVLVGSSLAGSGDLEAATRAILQEPTHHHEENTNGL